MKHATPTARSTALFALAVSLGLATSACAASGSIEGDDATDQGSSDLAAGCAKQARVFSYDPVGWEHLSAAFAKNPSPCVDYYFHLPAIAGNKTTPRSGSSIDDLHALGSHFHALAEFHWGAWSAVTTMSWHDKGVEFRKRMLDAGYEPGVDAWAINELPSSVRSDATVRQHVRDLVQGLYDGPSGADPTGGLVYIEGMGSKTTNFSVYEPNLEDWLSDGDFWADMNQYVRWWGQEAYADPLDVCVGSATVATRANHVSAYAMHPSILASAGPSAAAEARSFFDESYVPILSAFYKGDVYGTKSISLANMEAFASTGIYAARAWSNTHDAPDWHVGLAWNEHPDGASDADVTALADRIASAVRWAYPEDGSGGGKACGTSGAYTACKCSISGAAFNEGWATFSKW